MHTLEEILKRLGPDLKAEGFRKRRYHFAKHVEELKWLISFQKGKCSDSAGFSFTIEVGIYHEPLSLVEGWSAQTIPAAWDGQINERAGFLTPRQEDLWWHVAEDDDLDAVVSEIRILMRDNILPYLQQFPGRAAFKKHFEMQLKKEYFFFSDVWHLCQLLALEGNEEGLRIRLVDLAKISQEDRNSDDLIQARESELLDLLNKSRG